MHLTVLPAPLRLIRLKNRAALNLLMHPIASQVLCPRDVFFAFTMSKSEISLIVTEERLGQVQKTDLEVSPVVYKALQVDDIGVEQNGDRIHHLSECLSDAGISIFYVTTYQTDFILVEDSLVNDSFEALRLRFKSSSPNKDSISVDISERQQQRKNSVENGGPLQLQYNVKEYSKKLQLVGIMQDMLPLAAGLLLKMIFYDGDTEFISYAVTPDGISIIMSEESLEDFPQHILNTGVFDSLELLEADLREFTLEQYGIVKSLSAPLVAAEVNILLVSTFGTANVLMESKNFQKAMEVLKENNLLKSVSK